MGDELEVEILGIVAGAAGAGRVDDDRVEALAKAEIERLDGIDDLARRPRGVVVGEGEEGIALDVRKRQRRAQPLEDDGEEILEDTLGVIELAARQKARVAADVGGYSETAWTRTCADAVVIASAP
jgi:hypothetical protein